jgi:hypothetical protein
MRRAYRLLSDRHLLTVAQATFTSGNLAQGTSKIVTTDTFRDELPAVIRKLLHATALFRTLKITEVILGETAGDLLEISLKIGSCCPPSSTGDQV